MTMRVALNIVNLISMPCTLLAGLLIVSTNFKRKLWSIGLYGFTNLCLVAVYFITGAETYLLNAIIFGSLTITNLFQVLAQMRKVNDTH